MAWAGPPVPLIVIRGRKPGTSGHTGVGPSGDATPQWRSGGVETVVSGSVRPPLLECRRAQPVSHVVAARLAGTGTLLPLGTSRQRGVLGPRCPHPIQRNSQTNR